MNMRVSEVLKKKLEEFAKTWGFLSYEIEDDGELIFFKPTPLNPKEVFVLREFEPRSEIRRTWFDLQCKVDDEWIDYTWETEAQRGKNAGN